MADPTGQLADGNVMVRWAPAILDVLAPKLTETGAATAFDSSCYLTTFTPGTSEATVTDERICSRQVFEDVGRFTDSIALAYVYQAQLPLATDNKCFATWKRLVGGFLIVRWGIDFSTALAVGHIVDIYPVRFGVQKKQAPEGNTKLKIMQDVKVTGTVARDVVMAA